MLIKMNLCYQTFLYTSALCRHSRTSSCVRFHQQYIVVNQLRNSREKVEKWSDYQWKRTQILGLPEWSTQSPAGRTEPSTSGTSGRWHQPSSQPTYIYGRSTNDTSFPFFGQMTQSWLRANETIPSGNRYNPFGHYLRSLLAIDTIPSGK